MVHDVEPHGQARGTFLDARGAEPLRSRVLLRRCLVGTALLRAMRFEAAAAKLQRSRAASQQHPRFAFLPAQGRGFRRRRVIRRVAWVGLLLVPLAGCMSVNRLRDDTPQATSAISDPLEAHWSSTTLEAASTPQHRRILEHGHVETITGEVVDVSCFLQLGKRGEAHIACGQKCVRNGQPVGVLTDKGRLYLIMPEEHHPRRDGQVSVKDRFAELMGKRVQVSGMVTKYNDLLAMFITSPPAPAAAEPQPAQ